MNKPKNILIISAHADDHVLFAGSIFKLQERGYQVYEVVLTNSGEGNHHHPKKVVHQREIVKLRQNELDKASQFLGTIEKFMLMEEDLNLLFTKEIMLKLVKIIRQVKPEIIFTLNEVDYHKDHIATAKIAQEAALWAANNLRPELGNPHRTNFVLFGEGFLPIEPDILIDISTYKTKKMELFKIYESQADKKSIILLKSLMNIRGYHLRKDSQCVAESFTVSKHFPSILFN